MDLKTAAWYASIGTKRLKQLAADGTIRGFKDPDDGRNGWIFDRYSLDKYRESQDPDGEIDQKVLEIMGRFK
jgi:hypothetical protein